MEEDSLDHMDPYQRGATDIIWSSMMKGSYKSPNKEHPQDQDYAESLEPSNSGNHLGSQEEASSNVEKYVGPNRYVIGPMVVRVLPDGRPVPGDAYRPLPKDEDAEEFLTMRAKAVPSIAELSSRRKQQPSVTVQPQMEHWVQP